MKKIITAVLAAVLIWGTAAGWIQTNRSARQTAAAQTDEAGPVIILDPGHGGIDGGAVSKTGLVEKEINLSIARKLRELLEVSGFRVVMTREMDCSIHDPTANTVKEIKTSDLHNRMKLMQEHPEGIFVSIHQNFFEQSQYSGAQFFYASTPGSKELAECFRRSVCTALQPDNRRETKLCGSSVYLIHRAVATAVLAECGFLSNPAEAAQLSSEAYQQQMAYALYCGLVDYLRQTDGG